MKKAIVLCSGGLDSVTTAYYVKKKLNYSNLKILFFNYGQKSLKSERKYSKLCAKQLKADFQEINIAFLKNISTSLINRKGENTKLTRKDLKNTQEESANWYVPCRNSLFIIYSLTLAEVEYVKDGVKSDIFLGFKGEGEDSYPDTTEDFVSKMNELSKISCKADIKIKAPLINKDKEEIIQIGNKLGVDHIKTFSCYINNKHCGTCLACMLRKEGFYWAGIEDPTKYLE